MSCGVFAHQGPSRHHLVCHALSDLNAAKVNKPHRTHLTVAHLFGARRGKANLIRLDAARVGTAGGERASSVRAHLVVPHIVAFGLVGRTMSLDTMALRGLPIRVCPIVPFHVIL